MKLKGILNIVLSISTNVVEKRLPKLIKNEWVLSIVQSLFAPFKQTLLALTDADPDNDEQMKAILIANAPTVIESNMLLLTTVLEPKLKDESLKALVAFKIQTLTDFLKIVTDSDPDDKTQIAQLVADNDEQAIDLSLEVLKVLVSGSKKINEDYKDLIIPTLDGIIDLELTNLNA